MPNRFVKESIRTSETLANISSDAERLFWRLVVTVDDFGRFDARPNVILGQCLSAFIGRITAEQVSDWLDELEQAGLIIRYEHDGKPYLALTSWDKHQQRRAKKSKFPPPPTSDITCDHVRADAPVFESEYESESENEISISTHDGKQSRVTKADVERPQPTLLPPLSNDDSLNLDAYCQEIERQMVACGASPSYTATGESFKWVKRLHDNGVPIDCVRRGIVEAYSRNPDIKSFAYCAQVIKDLWARELEKRKPAQPLEFQAHIHARGQREPPVVYGPITPRTLPAKVAAALEEDDD
jgi:hypothetical protein